MLSYRKLVGAAAVLAAVLVVSGCAPGGGPGTGSGEGYPASGEAVTFVIPYPAGGSTDIAGRSLASALETELGIPVEVLNIEGAAQQVGMTSVALADADGYTLGYSSMPSLTSTYLQEGSSAVYDQESFTPLATHYVLGNVIMVRADSPYQNLEEIVSAARENPNTVRIGTSQRLATPHLVALQWQSLADVEFNIANLGGDAEVGPALLGGHIDVGIVSSTVAVQLLQGGDLRALASTSVEPFPTLPDIPTAGSQGYDLVLEPFSVVVAPAGLPENVTTVLSDALEAVMADPTHLEAAERLGFVVRWRDPQATAQAWQEAEEFMRGVLAEAE